MGRGSPPAAATVDRVRVDRRFFEPPGQFADRALEDGRERPQVRAHSGVDEHEAAARAHYERGQRRRRQAFGIETAQRPKRLDVCRREHRCQRQPQRAIRERVDRDGTERQPLHARTPFESAAS
jgi:hypothetical protein